ncbi:MAG: hypothetical protein ACOY5C_04890 [Pseudomonadota bacterium]
MLSNRVRCGDCRRFVPDARGNGSGIGACRVDAWRRGQPALWPNAQRHCTEWRRK